MNFSLTMIATNILYICFLSAGWVSAVSAALTGDEQSAIDNFLQSTDQDGNWAPAYFQIESAVDWTRDYVESQPNVLDRSFSYTFEAIGVIVDKHLNHDYQQGFSHAVNIIPRYIYLLRYSMLRFIIILRPRYGPVGSGSAVGVIDNNNVSNVAAQFQRQKEKPMGPEQEFIPYMLDVTVLSVQIQSMLNLRVSDAVRARFDIHL
jgi:hypothetical protein